MQMSLSELMAHNNIIYNLCVQFHIYYSPGKVILSEYNNERLIIILITSQCLSACSLIYSTISIKFKPQFLYNLIFKSKCKFPKIKLYYLIMQYCSIDCDAEM